MAGDHSTRASRGKKSWRGEKMASVQRRNESRQFARWFFTVLGIVLIGIVVWVLTRPVHQVEMLVWGVWDESNSMNVVPPMLFVAEDLQSLKELNPRSIIVDELAAQGNADAKSGNLSAMIKKHAQSKSNDCQIFYLSGQGIESNGEGYLLTKPWINRREAGNLDESAKGESITDILNAVSSSKSRVKLLVIDDGAIGTDPRLGLLINDFPHLVYQAVKKRNDPSLWVILSSGSLESRGIVPSLQRSAFAHFLQQGLDGAADASPADEWITLNELYGYLRTQVSRWPEPRLVTQIPLLFHAGAAGGSGPEAKDGGRGGEPIDSNPKLVRVVPRAGSNAKQDSSSDSEKKPSDDAADKTEKTTSAGNLWPSPWIRSTGERRLALLQTGDNAAVKSAGKTESSKSGEAPKAPAAGSTGSASPPAKGGEPSPPDSVAAPPTPQSATPAASSPSTATPPASPSGDPGAAPKSPLASNERLMLVIEAWKLRDAIENPPAAATVTPAEFAPHLWRQFNAHLVELETRSRAGKAFDGQTIREQLLQLVRDLEALARALQSNQPARELLRADPVSYLKNLAEAWQAYLASKEFKSFQRAAPAAESESRLVIDWEKLKLGVREHARLAVRAAEYVTLCGGESGGANLSCDQVRGFLEDLREYSRELAEHQRKPVNESIFFRLQDRLAKAQRDDEALREELDTRVRGCFDTASAMAPWRAHRLLQSSLIRTPEREKLLALLWNSQAQPTPVESGMNSWSGGVSPDPGNLTFDQLVWLRGRVRLEMEILERDATSDTAKQAGSDLLRALENARQRSEIAGPLANVQQELQRAFRRRVQATREGANGNSLRELGYHVDVRDASQLPAENDLRLFLPLLIDPPRPENSIRLSVTDEQGMELNKERSAQSLGLAKNNFRKLTFSVKPVLDENEFRSLRLSWRIRVDGGKRVIIREVGGKEIPSGTEFHSSGIAEEASKQLEFAANEEKGGLVEVSFEVTVGSLMPRRLFDCSLPYPNRIDLVVDGPSIPSRIEGSDVAVAPDALPEQALILPVYPGDRSSDFVFWLRNNSKQSKDVIARLYQLPARPTVPWAPWHVVHESRILDAVRKDFETGKPMLLAEAPLHLEPGDELVRLNLATPQPTGGSPAAGGAGGAGGSAAGGTAGGAAGGGAAAGTQPESPGAASGPPMTIVSHGMVLQIVDAADAKQKWTKWLEMKLINPAEYVDWEHRYERPSGGGDGFGRASVRVKLKDRDGDGVVDPPPDMESKTIPVTWDSPIPYVAGKSDTKSGQLRAKGQPVELSRDLGDMRSRIIVPLTIDGFPRAVRLLIDRDTTAVVPNAANLDRDQEAVISQVRIKGEPVAFMPLDVQKVPPPILDPMTKKESLVYLPKDAPWIVKIDEDDSERMLEVRLAVNTSPLQFLPHGRNADGRDAVELTMRDRGRSREVFSETVHTDRDRIVRLKPVMPGRLSMTASVSDPQFEISLGGLRNTVLELRVQLQLARENPRSHSLVIHLDGQKPEIAAVKLPASVMLSKPLEFRLQCLDEHLGSSGIHKVEASLLKSGTDTSMPIDPANVIARGTSTDEESNHWYEIRIETAKIMEVGKYPLRIRVLDRAGHEREEFHEVELTKTSKNPLFFSKEEATGKSKDDAKKGKE